MTHLFRIHLRHLTRNCFTLLLAKSYNVAYTSYIYNCQLISLRIFNRGNTMRRLPHNIFELVSRLPGSWTTVLGLLEAAGDMEQPKVFPIPVRRDNSDQPRFIALYSANQGQNVGRRSEFEDVYWLGGRVVDRSTPPAHGVVEMSRFPDSLDGIMETPYPWPVSQILWLDDSTFVSLVKDGETWLERERFLINSLRRKPREWMSEPDPEGVKLYEFLHRALTRWDEITRPEILARFVASHARAYQPVVALNWFSLESGFDATNEELAANILRAADYLEMVRGCLTPDIVKRNRVVYGRDEPDRYPFNIKKASTSGSQENFVRTQSHTDHNRDYETNHIISYTPTTEPALKILIDAVVDSFRDDNYVAEFCRKFLAEIFAAKELPENFDPDSMLSASKQVQAIFASFPMRPDSKVLLIDGNAGYGDYLIAAIENMPKNSLISSIHAYEANPVAFQVSCLRVESALKTRPNVSVSVTYHNVYRDGFMDWLEGNYVFVGEARPHVIKGASLEVEQNGGHKARYGWGRKLQNQSIAIASYLEAIDTVLRRNSTASKFFSLRVPFEWAEDIKHAEERQRFFNLAGDVYVDDSGVTEELVDRRQSRGDIILLAGDLGEELAPTKPYVRVAPSQEVGFSFIPGHSADDYMAWLSLPHLFLQKKPLNGPIERRGMTLIDIDRHRLADRLADYFGKTPDDILREKHPAMVNDTKQFDARETRKRLRAQGFSPENITKYDFRPFDARYVYVKDVRPLFSEPATALFSLAEMGDSFLVASAGNPRTDMGIPVWFGSMPCDYDFFAGRSGHFPVWIKETVRIDKKLAERRCLNISDRMREFLDLLGFKEPESSREIAELLWMHVLAVLCTPNYLKKHREALRLDWPRIPVPGLTEDIPIEKAKAILVSSANLGRRVAEVLVHDKMIVDPKELGLGQWCVDGKPSEAENTADRHRILQADWGSKIGSGSEGKANAVRPRPGTLSKRPYRPGEISALVEIAKKLDIGNFDFEAVFGDYVVDVQCNHNAYWSGVPAKVWDCVIGGRRVLSKWLSYREFDILDRPLYPEEIQYFGNMVNRLTRLLLLSVKLDRLWMTWQQ